MQDVQLAPTVNIMDMVAQKCEDMKMLKDVETVRDQTRGELSRAATQMRTMQEAMVSQQTRMSRLEDANQHRVDVRRGLVCPKT